MRDHLNAAAEKGKPARLLREGGGEETLYAAAGASSNRGLIQLAFYRAAKKVKRGQRERGGRGSSAARARASVDLERKGRPTLDSLRGRKGLTEREGRQETHDRKKGSDRREGRFPPQDTKLRSHLYQTGLAEGHTPRGEGEDSDDKKITFLLGALGKFTLPCYGKALILPRA